MGGDALCENSEIPYRLLGTGAVILGPPIIVALLVLAGMLSLPAVRNFLYENWGDVASVWGLLVGAYVLLVATGARRAAEETRNLARKRGLVEELEDANKNVQQVGLFIRQQQWDLVNLRAEEVLTSCGATLARWEKELQPQSANRLLTASTIMRTIANIASKSSVRALTDGERLRMAGAQLEAAGLLSSVLGDSRSAAERSTQP